MIVEDSPMINKANRGIIIFKKVFGIFFLPAVGILLF
jgi:hypothetical protein